MAGRRRKRSGRGVVKEVPAAAAGAVALPRPWIMDPVRDLVLFVGTPLLIVPTILLAELLWSSSQLHLFVASFGAVGHHLPGMMRAYGDRALFARFRTRFIVAPIFLLAVCLFFAFTAKDALLLMAFGWSMWHGLMQTHGFARIYDSKAGSLDRLTAVLDQGLCLSWFAAAIAFSPARMYFLTDHFLRSGGPAPTRDFIATVQGSVAVITGLVTVAFVANVLYRWKTGTPPSVVKLLLLLSTLSFFWYANIVVEDMLLAIVLFELFHDVQYLSIVWLFNRRRVDSDPAVGRFTQYVFRPRHAMIALYVALVFLYGGLNLPTELLPPGTLTTLLAGLLAASGFLHFYYDGFIWKVREKETRRTLGIEGGEDAAGGRAGLPGWLSHGLRWAVLFVLPLSLLGIATARGPVEERERIDLLAATFPEDAAAQRNRALALRADGDLVEAIVTARKAVAIDVGDEETRQRTEASLAALLVEAGTHELSRGRFAEAAVMFREAVSHDPASVDRVIDTAVEVGQSGNHPRAIAILGAVLEAAPDHGHAHFNAAVSHAALGRLGDARRHAARSVELMPGEDSAAQMLASIEAAMRSSR